MAKYHESAVIDETSGNDPYSVAVEPETEAAIDSYMALPFVPYTDDEIATSAIFDARHCLLLVTLRNGARIAIPQEDLQDLHDVDPAKAAHIELMRDQASIFWPELMIELPVKGLADGLRGNAEWMRNLQHRRTAVAA